MQGGIAGGNMKARNTRYVALVAMMLAMAAAVAAQDFRGTIEGTVADSTGGVLPGVTVTVANASTGVEQHVVTDDAGRYRVLYLNPAGIRCRRKSPASRSSCDSTTKSAWPRSHAST